MSKFIGLVSAYAYAQSKGYTGTEEEFAILMAEYASVTETAVEAVRIATESARSAAAASSDVNRAAATVTQQATQVHDDAETSSESAATASEAKETAVDKALDSEAYALGTRDGEDVGSSDPAYHNNAKYYAEQGGAEVTAAQQARQGAESAQSLAETAQGKAEEAQTGAETAQARITENLEQIEQNAEDISALKNDFAQKVDTQYMQKCELIHQPASANKFNASAAQIGLVHTNGNIYTGTTYDAYRYYNIGFVEAGSIIKTYTMGQNAVRPGNAARIVAFDSNNNVMSSDSAIDVNTYTVPSGADHIIITVGQNIVSSFMVIINSETAPSGFIPYSEDTYYYVATKDFIPDNIIANKVDVDGMDQVTLRNAQFMHKSPNLIDLSKVTDGYFVNQANGALNESALHTATDWIPVTENTIYTFSFSGIHDCRICWYDVNKKFLSGEYYSTNESSFSKVSPAGARYIRFSTISFANSSIQFEEGPYATPYMAYGTGYLLPEFAPPEKFDITINLPSKIYALVGYELNIYFENLIEDWERYDWDVICSKGMQLERGFRVTPVESDIGEYTLTIIVSLSDTAHQTFTCTLVIASATAGDGIGKSIIILGDSTTNNGIAVTKLNANFSGDAMNIETLGTRGTSPNKHEGRSGWKFSSYFGPPNAGDVAAGVENPWYNPTSKTFDASYYFTETGIAKPDWFFINLGVNDVFAYSDDSNLENQIASCKSLCDSMIASMQAASPNTKIGICLTIPPNHSQDAFGKAYFNGQTQHRYKRNNVIWVNRLIAEYDNRESEGIYLIPIHTNLDTVYNMGMETLPVNARNTAVTYQSPISNGGVHPVESGYWQIADVYTAFLKAHAED